MSEVEVLDVYACEYYTHKKLNALVRVASPHIQEADIIRLLDEIETVAKQKQLLPPLVGVQELDDQYLDPSPAEGDYLVTVTLTNW